MKIKKINSILKEVLEKAEPPEKDLKIIKNSLEEFLEKVGKKIKKLKIDAEIFVGGSYAKKTMIKKGQYDIDVFVRFDEKYRGKNISELTEKAIKKIKGIGKILRIHGSRDYFKVNVNSSFFIEVIPVIKIRKPKKAENITDLSYSHVKYIKKKIKSEKVLDEIKLAKSFCYANKCYGAESYINGFSGYAIELLIIYYKSFLNFIKAMTKIKDKKIIDIEKQYKTKYEVEMNMNSSKLNSPIILIDPTYKERNALAALSKETFEKFQKACKKFLKNPSIKAFEIKRINPERIKKNAMKQKAEFILIKAETDKQKGDVAGSKLAKFYRHLREDIIRFYKITNSGFNYKGEKSAEYFFVVKKREKIILRGPKIKDKENTMMFKKKHKNTFEKKRRIYAIEKINLDVKKFIDKWKIKNKKKMEDMHITELKIID